MKKYEITLIEYKLATRLIKAQLDQLLIDNDALQYKEYTAACSDMKKGWKNADLTKELSEDFNDSEIVGSTFAQDEPFTDVFPEGVVNCILTNCDSGNCNIPAGYTVNGGTNKHYAKQNDGENWIIDTELKLLLCELTE